MRDFMFRGKRVDNGEWVYGYFWRNAGGSFIQSWLGNVYGGIHEVKFDTVGQYFGIKDFKDNDLYPGDVIKTKHTRTIEEDWPNIEFYEKVGQLEYHHGYNFGPRLRWNKGHMMIPNTSTLWRLKSELVGNIFDNPELINGGIKNG